MSAADNRSQSYGGDLRESFSSTTSASASRTGTNSTASGGRLNPATGGPVVRRLFAEESQRSFGAGNIGGNTCCITGASTSGGTRNNTVSRSSFAPSPTNNNSHTNTGEPAPQLLRSPPPGYKPDFDA